MESYKVTVSTPYPASLHIVHGPLEYWYRDSVWAGICVDKIKKVIAKQGWYKQVYLDLVGNITTEIHIVKEDLI